MENLFSQIKQCKSEKEVKKLVDKALEEAYKNSIKGATLGFDRESSKKTYKGFIHPKTRVRYSNMGIETYGMETTDYIYEYAIMVWKDEHLQNKQGFINSLESFINYYFGYPRYDRDMRYDFFFQRAWQETKTDDELFARLEKNQIGDLRGLGIAQCSERAAVAQNLLSLFGFESYYCTGAVKHNGKEEGHAFLVVKTANAYAIVDYSMPVTVTRENGNVYYLPYITEIKAEEFEEFLNGNVVKEFADYELLVNKGSIRKLDLDSKRYYMVGDQEMIKANQPGV